MKQRSTVVKKHAPAIIAAVLFLLVNTTYYWDGKLGFFALPAFLLLALLYLGLVIVLLLQLGNAVFKKDFSGGRLINIGVLAIVLLLVFLRPFGLVDFERFEGEDLLVAEREGVANCMITLKLKDDFSFRQREVCFGVTEVKGRYHLQHDTIYFDDAIPGRGEDPYFRFAVVGASDPGKGEEGGSLQLYKSETDTVGFPLVITQNRLSRLGSR